VSAVVKKFQKDASTVVTSSRSVESENSRLPMKLIERIEVSGPSLISNARSTRFCSSWMTLGSTVAAKRPERR